MLHKISQQIIHNKIDFKQFCNTKFNLFESVYFVRDKIVWKRSYIKGHKVMSDKSSSDVLVPRAYRKENISANSSNGFSFMQIIGTGNGGSPRSLLISTTRSQCVFKFKHALL